jgi:hypothetical protein
MRELTACAPTRSGRVITVQLDERSGTAVLSLFAAIETCLAANDIRSVHVELDGHSYLLAMP